MLSWKSFLESKGENLEDMEEKLGADLDNDNEKGEPLAHKKKVFGNDEDEDEDEEDDYDDEDDEEEEEEEEDDYDEEEDDDDF